MKNKKFLKSAALALGTVASVAAPIAAVVSCGTKKDEGIVIDVRKFTAAQKADDASSFKEIQAEITSSLTEETKSQKFTIVNSVGTRKTITLEQTADGKDLSDSSKKALASLTEFLADKNVYGKARYNTDEAGTVKIMTGFSASGPQRRALDKQVAAWNTLHPNEKIEVSPVEGGYTGISQGVQNMLTAKEKVNLPNMVIDYPDVIGTLTAYGMQLPLEKDRKAADSISSKFSEQFLEVNDQIGNVAPGQLLAMPVSKSIEMAGWNTPVLNYVWKQAKEAGIVVTGLPGDFTKNAAADLAGVKTAWGVTDANAAEGVKTVKAEIAKITGFTPLTFDGIKNNAADMLSFITLARGLFPKSDANFLLGIDSTANFLYSSIYQLAGEDYAKFIFSKGTDAKGKLDYNFKDATVKANIEKFYNALKGAVDAGAVYMNEGGAYSSGKETQHHIMVSYGSTAGYSYDFKGQSTPIFNGANLVEHTDELVTSKPAGGKLGVFGKFNNKIFLSTVTNPVKASSYDVYIANAATDAKVNALIAAATSGIFVTSDAGVAKAYTADTTKIVKIAGGNYPKFLIAADSMATTVSTLQENEFVVTTTPTKFEGTETAKATLVQGPSLIGVHGNDRKDGIVKAFAKWFVTENGGTSPAQTFAREAGYVIPLTGALTGLADNSLDPAQKLTHDTIKTMSTDDTYHPFDNPVDGTTGTTRTTLESDLNDMYNAVVTDAGTKSFADIYKLFEETAGGDSIF